MACCAHQGFFCTARRPPGAGRGGTHHGSGASPAMAPYIPGSSPGRLAAWARTFPGPLQGHTHVSASPEAPELNVFWGPGAPLTPLTQSHPPKLPNRPPSRVRRVLPRWASWKRAFNMLASQPAKNCPGDSKRSLWIRNLPQHRTARCVSTLTYAYLCRFRALRLHCGLDDVQLLQHPGATERG